MNRALPEDISLSSLRLQMQAFLAVTQASYWLHIASYCEQRAEHAMAAKRRDRRMHCVAFEKRAERSDFDVDCECIDRFDCVLQLAAERVNDERKQMALVTARGFNSRAKCECERSGLFRETSAAVHSSHFMVVEQRSFVFVG